jgi:hypothetical protein
MALMDHERWLIGITMPLQRLIHKDFASKRSRSAPPKSVHLTAGILRRFKHFSHFEFFLLLSSVHARLATNPCPEGI